MQAITDGHILRESSPCDVFRHSIALDGCLCWIEELWAAVVVYRTWITSAAEGESAKGCVVVLMLPVTQRTDLLKRYYLHALIFKL
jgi:hypothetical protein